MKMNRGNKIKKTFCKDCPFNPKTCKRNPLDCMKSKEANLYFRLYDSLKGSIGSDLNEYRAVG